MEAANDAKHQIVPMRHGLQLFSARNMAAASDAKHKTSFSKSAIHVFVFFSFVL